MVCSFIKITSFFKHLNRFVFQTIPYLINVKCILVLQSWPREEKKIGIQYSAVLVSINLCLCTFLRLYRCSVMSEGSRMALLSKARWNLFRLKFASSNTLILAPVLSVKFSGRWSSLVQSTSSSTSKTVIFQTHASIHWHPHGMFIPQGVYTHVCPDTDISPREIKTFSV